MNTPKRGIGIVRGLVTAVLVGVVALAGGCDPNALPGKAEAGDKKAGDAKAGEAGEAAASEAGEAGEVAAAPATREGCLAECEQAILSDDNRATCRLRCKSAHGGDDGDGGTKHPTVGAYFGCFDECGSKSETNRVTCRKNCATSVASGSGDPAASKCPRGCLEALGACLTPCADKGEDDAATCRKRCELTSTKCVTGCG